MPRSRTTALLTLALLAAAMLAGAAQQHDGPAAPPLVQWAGHESKRAEAGFVLIRDAAAWDKLWAEHAGLKSISGGAMERNLCPKIDFARCAVVAYFRGKSVNCDGEIAESVSDTGDHVVVRFQSSSFQTFSLDGNGGAEHTTPFGIWVIPAAAKAIAVEEGVRANGLKNDPITWKEVHRFPAQAGH